MPEIRIPTDDGGAVVVDAFDDESATAAIAVPAHLDEPTLAFLAEVSRRANEQIQEARRLAAKAGAAAEHEVRERLAAHFESKAGGRSCLVPSHVAAAEARSLTWERSAA